MKIISKMLVLFLIFSCLLIISTDPVGAHWQYGGNEIDFFASIYYHQLHFYSVGSVTTPLGNLNLCIYKINNSGEVVDADTVNSIYNDSCSSVYRDNQNNLIIIANNSQNIPRITKYSAATGNYFSIIRDPIEEEEEGGGATGNNGTEEEDIYAFVGSRRPSNGIWNILVYETQVDLSCEGMPEFIIPSEINHHGYGIISLNQGEYTGEYLIVGCREDSQYIAKININTGQVLDEWVGHVGKFYSVIDGGDGCAWICGYEILPENPDKRLVLAQYEISSGRMALYYSPYTIGINTIGYDIIKSSNNFFIVGDKITDGNNSAIVDIFDLTGAYINTYSFNEAQGANGRGVCVLPNNIYICGCINIEDDNLDAFIEFMQIENEKDSGDPNLPMNPDHISPEFQNTDVSIQLMSPLIFNQTVNIQFEVFKKQNVQIKIYDVSGSEVCFLTDKIYTPGIHSITWDAINKHQQLINYGIYFIQFNASNQILTEKLIFTR